MSRINFEFFKKFLLFVFLAVGFEENETLKPYFPESSDTSGLSYLQKDEVIRVIIKTLRGRFTSANLPAGFLSCLLMIFALVVLCGLVIFVYCSHIPSGII